MKLRVACVVVGFLLSVLSTVAQTTASSTASAQVPPPLIQLSNVAADERGNTLSGVVSITFSLYTGQQGGEPLWTETQNNIQLDATGHYSVQLGVTKPAGVPTALFVTGAARWLGVRIEEQAEQPRVLLLSVPYALKAGDAATIGGLPPSAFLLAAPGTAPADSTPTTTSAAEPSAPPPAGTVTGSGTIDFIPLWTSSSNIGNSVLFQSGTGSTAKIGINTNTPDATLDVKGGTNLEGLLTLPATGTATASTGRTSQAQNFVASSYNSGTAAAVNQTFQWRAEPLGNDTATPSGALSLLFSSGTASPAETGLKLSNKGLFTFATGQTFPNTGTLTGVTTGTGSGLTGGGTKGTLNLALKTCAANQVLQFVSGAWTCSNAGTGTITGVTAGTDLTGGGTSGSVTLSLDTTKVPQLGTANTFTANQSVTGNVTVSGSLGVGIAASPFVLRVGTFNNGLRVEGPPTGGAGMVAASFGGNGDFAIDAPGITAGRFVVKDTTGNVGIGIAKPANQLDVYAQSYVNAINAVGFNAPSGSDLTGGGAIAAQGGANDPVGGARGGPGVYAVGGADLTGSSEGGAGVEGYGGSSSSYGGYGVVGAGGRDNAGGYFQGGSGTQETGDGVDVFPGSGYAGDFFGDVNINGTVYTGAKDFKIDHPLDPANKYLFHASVESSEMMNIYTGNITTDSQGQATVQLPEWFEVLNTDFRYQLTVIGQFAQAIIGRQDRKQQLRDQDERAQRRSVLAGHRRAAGCLCQSAPAGGGGGKGSPAARLLYPSRVLRRAAREADRMGAPSANDEEDAGNESPAVGRSPATYRTAQIGLG